MLTIVFSQVHCLRQAWPDRVICAGCATAVRLAEAQFPPPAEGVDMRLPGVNRFTAEAVQPLPHEKDQGGWAGLL